MDHGYTQHARRTTVCILHGTTPTSEQSSLDKTRVESQDNELPKHHVLLKHRSGTHHEFITFCHGTDPDNAWMETSNTSRAASLGVKLFPTPRTVCQNVARDLRTFRTARDLVSCLADAMEAHQKAYEALGMLHGDVSPEKILIMMETRGILMDWDRCRSMCMPKPGASTSIHRIRTWQFMSANLTMNPETASHGLLDDQESAFYVLMYMAFRYLRHDKVNYLRSYLAMFDEYYVLGDGYLSGWPLKKSIIMCGDVDIAFEIPAIKTLIDVLCKHFAALYRFRQESPGLVDPPSEWDEHLATTTPPSNVVDALQYYTRRFHQDCLQSINKTDWLYSYLRNCILDIPDRAAHESDWVDNTTVLREVPRNNNGKRGRANDQWDQKRESKFIKSRDGSARAIDPILELPPAHSLAAFVGTRLSLPRSGTE